MSPMRARYVTACQQLLALGVVVIALVPATRVVSLDVVGVSPGEGVAQPRISVSPTRSVDAPEVGMSGYARGRQHCAASNARVDRRAVVAAGSDGSCRGRTPARRNAPGAG